MLKRKRLGAVASCAALGLGVMGMAGCDPEGEGGRPGAPAVPGKTASAPPAAAEPFTIVYTAERLKQLGVVRRSEGDREFISLRGAPPEARTARFEIRPLVLKNDCLPATYPGSSLPPKLRMGFNLASRDEIEDPCVFDLLMGPEEACKGTFAASEKDIDIIVKAGEPMYAAKTGYAILGGKNPVVRGRRSRAGAPGTWMALKIEGDDPKMEGYREVYFLLNTAENAGHKVKVYLGVPRLAHEEDGTPNPCEPQGDPLVIDHRDRAVVVKGSCSFEVIDLSVPEHSSLKEFRDLAAKLAECAELPGNDPRPDDPTSVSTTVSPAGSTPR